MKDIDIRKVLLRELEERFSEDPCTRIVEELGLCQGTFRIDVAAVNGALHGYEIKSERDTLKRLPAQRNAYNSIFDTVTIVTGPKYASLVVNHIPPWWGILVARQEGEDVCLSERRAAGDNPAIDPSALAQLLWRDEALNVLSARGLADGVRNKPRPVLWSRLAEMLTVGELSHEVRRCLRSREGWRSAELRV